MKTLALTLGTSILAATSALAAGDISAFDRNGDRFATMEELSAVHPDLTYSDFHDIDLNRDRRISATEIATGEAQAILGRYTGRPGAVGLAEVDVNGDNFVSFTELAAAYPGVTAADWNDLDTNDDRRLSHVEFNNGRSVVARYEGGTNDAVVSLDAIDVDGSRFADFGEVASAYPGLTALDFNDLDQNKDNRISFSELYEGQRILDRK